MKQMKQSVDVLIVDDEPKLARNLEILLQWEGYQTRVAGNGQEAIQLIKQAPPKVILTDIMMPKLDGLGLLDYVQQNLAHVPVVTLTGFGSIDSAIKAMQAGAFDYVLKPFDTDLIVETIARAVKQARRNYHRELRRAMSLTISGTLELEEVMTHLLSLSIQGTRAQNGSLFILDENGQVVHDILLADVSQPKRRETLVGQVMGGGLAGWLYAHRQSVLITDTSQDDRWLVLPGRPYQTCSVLGLPFISHGVVQAVMVLVHSQINHFDEVDLYFVESVAVPAAMAIENGRLFKREQQQNQKLAAILHSTTDVVIAIDNEDNVLLANPATATSFELEPDQVLATPYQQALRDTALVEMFEQVKAADKPLVLELEAASHRTYYANAVPIPDVGYVAVLRDISHLKELDHMRLELLSTASHDLKNPLSIIRGYIDILKMGTRFTPEQQQGMFEKIEIAAFRMTDLITDLLDLARLESGLTLQPIICSVNALIQEAVPSIKDQAALKEITLATELDVSLHEVKCDPKRITQVLFNLLSNAVKYTPDGGVVILKSTIAPTELTTDEQPRVLVSIEDTGYGLAAEHLDRIFDRFYRVHTDETSNIEGTGLGLAIVKSIIEQHGGKIWAESEVGQGTTFYFII